MEMAHLRGLGLLAVVGLVIAVSGCTSAPSTAQVADLHRQAQEALARWDAAAASGAGASGFVLVGESTLMVGGDWGPNIDGNNAKMAWYAGLFVVANPLPSEVPPDGTIQWPDGTTHSVPVISAQQAFSDMKAGGVSPCPNCTALQVTGARLTTATSQSSREDVAEKLAPFLEIGYRHLIAGFPAPYDEESMTRLITEVKPVLERA
jgi:hypothetical protein